MGINKDLLAIIIAACRGAFFYVLFLSCLINILMLTIPVYMLQVFDRVIPSQSHDTLIYLTLIAIIAILVLSMLDVARTFIMIKIGTWLDNQLSSPALNRSIDNILSGGNYATQVLADITNLRQFLSSSSIYAFFDAPWIFIYLIVIFLLYLPLGILSTVGAVLLFSLAVLNEKVSRTPLGKANAVHIKNQRLIRDNFENAESIQAMGMIDVISKLWFHKNKEVLNLQEEASRKSGVVLSISKALRMALQILILGGGAYYVVNGDITSGAMLAASIILSRALAPIEQSIGVWKQAVSSLAAYSRLKKYFNEVRVQRSDIQLPQPKGMVSVEKLTYVSKGATKPILQNVNFALNPGESLAIIGASGSGKSTLARLLVGVWLPNVGNVRLDGADIYHCSREHIGQYIGYLPQGLDLFFGNVKQNIARMNLTEDKLVISAAKFVNAHEMILHLKDGYETETDSYNLSGGQKQMIGLARAFYGLPRFVVLDEPESNLDEQGMHALELTFKRAKAAGITIVMVTQRPSCADFCDKVMAVVNGCLVNVRAETDANKPKS